MKLFTKLALVLLVSPVAMASTGKLSALDCVGNNGVTINTVKQTKTGVSVVSMWFGLTKNFVARLTDASLNSESYVDLVNKKGEVLYSIALDLNPSRHSSQKVTGTILAPSLISENEAREVTDVTCTVTISEQK